MDKEHFKAVRIPRRVTGMEEFDALACTHGRNPCSLRRSTFININTQANERSREDEVAAIHILSFTAARSTPHTPADWSSPCSGFRRA